MSINKTKFLIIFLIGFFVVILISAILIKPKSLPQNQFSVKSNPINNQAINLKDPVVLNFSSPFKLEDLVINVEPITAINITADSTNTILTITPAQSWRMKENYTIKILKKSLSATGQSLNNDFTYQFTTTDHL